jgi:hypothetical protein
MCCAGTIESRGQWVPQQCPTSRPSLPHPLSATEPPGIVRERSRRGERRCSPVKHCPASCVSGSIPTVADEKHGKAWPACSVAARKAWLTGAAELKWIVVADDSILELIKLPD